MRSPFAIFRKHQKLLTVVLTGLAMFAFVILGAVNDPSNMPPALIVIFVACMFGSVGWLLGIRSKKSSEFGFAGLVIGTLLSVGAILAVGEPVRVKADSGNLNEREFDALRFQRAIANQFLAQAVQLVQQRNENQYVQPPAPFGFGHPDEEKDLVLGELLRREANELGIVVSDEMVNDYIRAATQGKLGAADVREIRNLLGISESDLYNILRSEIQAKFAVQYLYSQTVLPPESYWDFYRQLHVRQSVSIVPVPVQSFIDESSKPSESQLAELFEQYRDVFPNVGADNRLNEGQPGFRQPRKVRLAYVEAAYDPVESTVPPPTEEEIEAYYNEHFKPVPPEILEPQAKTEDAETDAETATDPDAASQEPAADRSDAPAPNSTDPSTETPDATETPDSAATPDGPRLQQPGGAEEPSSSDQSDDAAAAPEADTPDASAPEGTGSESEAEGSEAQTDDSDAAAFLPASAKTQWVAFLQDGEATDAPSQDAVTEAAAESEPSAPESAPTTQDDAATGQIAADGAEAAESPAAEALPATEDAAAAPSMSIVPDGPPPPPLAQPAGTAGSSEPLAVRELDDALRQEIREQLLRERTEEKLQQVIEDANDFMRDLELKLADLQDDALDQLPEDASEAMQAEARQKAVRQILAELKAYAGQHGLTYVETPLLSALELRRSEDYPIGAAVDRVTSDPFNLRPASTVIDQVFRSEPREVFLSQQAVHPETESRFVYWKIEEQAEFTPESLSDPGIREQVADTWRELKAREKARKRAEELVKLAEGQDAPLSDVFAGETITGKPEAAAITVLQPSPFAWMTASDPRLSSFPWATQPPQRTQLPSVPGLIADSFMETIFDDLSEGEVGIAHSIDKEYFYVVRIDERTFGTAEDLQAFREAFMTEPLFAPYYTSHYPMLAQGKLQSYQSNLSDQLFKKHGVEILEPRHRRTAQDPSESSAY